MNCWFLWGKYTSCPWILWNWVLHWIWLCFLGGGIFGGNFARNQLFPGLRKTPKLSFQLRARWAKNSLTFHICPRAQNAKTPAVSSGDQNPEMTFHYAGWLLIGILSIGEILFKRSLLSWLVYDGILIKWLMKESLLKNLVTSHLKLTWFTFKNTQLKRKIIWTIHLHFWVTNIGFSGMYPKWCHFLKGDTFFQGPAKIGIYFDFPGFLFMSLAPAQTLLYSE